MLISIPSEHDSEFLKLFQLIIINGILGALVFLLLLASLTLVIIFCGNLPNSKQFVSSAGVGISYIAIFAAILWGFNMGFNTQTTQLFKLDSPDYKRIRIYFFRQMGGVLLYLLLSIGFIFMLYSVDGYIYKNSIDFQNTVGEPYIAGRNLYDFP